MLVDLLPLRSRLVSARVLAVILAGQEAAAIAGLPSVVAVARAEGARIRLASFRPLPRPRVDRYDRVVADAEVEMMRVSAAVTDSLDWAARQFEGVAIDVVVRFGTPRIEVVTEVELLRPSFVACFATQDAAPLARLRAWALRRRLTHATGARMLVVQSPRPSGDRGRRAVPYREPGLSIRGGSAM